MNCRTATLAVVLITAVAAPDARAEEKPKGDITIAFPYRPRLGSDLSWSAVGLEFEFPFAGMSAFITPTLENPLDGQPLNIGGDLGVRFYPFAPVPRVFYIAPYIGGSWVNGTRSASLGVQIEGRVGVLLGLNFLIADWILLGAAVGGEYYNIHELVQGAFNQSSQALGTVVRVSAGFAF